ncbi:receptor-type tyrosine-protein phosphatase alpha-like isoform X1 [Biomphalaria glabrata]|uniref:protein-tyrosine-phosphatase n=1 Tax=Biomphalaria glabrata TaxID=6526 RepID=A0A9W3AJA1_BIOGL|nr:receptor-type tyrosine-protein phosphatase alpha-like isoform X1 [Biomphalaria glabrata]
MNETTTELTLTGPALKFLCSLYISGGRNVALKQTAEQSSNYMPGGGASLAVDGITNQCKFNDGSTSHTDENQDSTWSLRLDTPKVVNRFVIYNRADCCWNRLKNFIMTAFDNSGKSLWTHRDTNTNTDAPLIYEFTQIQENGLFKITISPTYRETVSSSLIVSLCEVFMYGECVPGNWGLYCNQTCPEECSTLCQQDTGNCLSCLGHNDPPMCNTVCAPGTYGINCQQNCSNNCYNNSCDIVTGECNSGCNGYSDPPECTIECDRNHWGLNCQQNCSENCHNRTCNKGTGKCDSGCIRGYSNPPDCSLECASGKFGLNCLDNCSTNCYNISCDKETGKCDRGCSGYSDPPACTTECASGTFGFNCLKNCSTNCYNISCDKETGECDRGCSAYSDPPACTTECNSTKWGHNCQQDCNDSCLIQTCDRATGQCDQGCNGYSDPPNCSLACTNHTYGPNCIKLCSAYCSMANDTSENRCHHITGDCINGCVSGYTTSTCIQPIVSSNDTPIGAIVGACIAGLVIIVLILVAVIIWRRRRSQGDTENASLTKGSSWTIGDSQRLDSLKIFDTQSDPNSRTYCNIERIPENTAIYVSDLSLYIQSHEKTFLNEQYRKIPSPQNVTTEVASREEYKAKNRFKNICPYDHSRVHLKINTANHEGDYINASYIRGFNNEVTFIASQGPNEATLKDFIRMLWEQHVDKVVMLTNLIEEGKVKCEKYWPDETKMKLGDFKITLRSTQIFADYTIRMLEISKKGEARHTFTHFHYTSWPDKSIPTAPWSLVDFEQRVASNPTTRPIVVHCSAGVGRTGTFIALHNIIKQAEETKMVDFFQTVTRLREDRIFMIQTAEQYEFLHRAVNAALVSMKSISSTDVCDQIKRMEEKTVSGHSALEHEFKAICLAVAVDSIQKGENNEDSSIYENAEKEEKRNRFSSIIPKKLYQPFLDKETSDMKEYINAVLLPGFHKKDQILLTQLPLPVTVLDLYRLITQHNVVLLVAFELDKKVSDKSIGTYLPSNSNEPLSCPPFEVHSFLTSQGRLYEELTLTIHTSSGKHIAHHIQCKFTDLDTEKWCQLMKKVKSYNIQASEKVLYMCRNGAELCGLACLLSLLIDRVDFDSQLNVPLVVGSVKSIRPEVCPTLDQYRTLYRVLETYCEPSTVYTNGVKELIMSPQQPTHAPADLSESIYNNTENLYLYTNM